MSRLNDKRKRLNKQKRALKRKNVMVRLAENKRPLIVCAVGAVAILLVALMLFGEGGLLFGMGIHNSSKPIEEFVVHTVPCNVSAMSGFVPYKDDVLLCGRDGLKLINSRGETVWQVNIMLSNPFVSVSGDYILLSEYGGREVYIYNGGELVLMSRTQYSILNAKMEADGRFIVTTTEPYYCGMLMVKDLSDELLFGWHSGSAYIIDAALSGDGGTVAIATLGAQAPLTANVLLFDISGEEAKSTQVFENVIVSKLHYNADNTLTVLADDRLIGINTDGAISWTYSFGDTLEEAEFYGDLVMLRLGGASYGTSRIVVAESDGTRRVEADSAERYKCVGIYGKRIVCASNDAIEINGAGGEWLYTVLPNKDVRDVTLFNNARSALVIGNTSVDVIDIY